MSKVYRDLGPFSDLVNVAVKANKCWSTQKAGKGLSRRFLKSLNFSPRASVPLQVKAGEKWERDGVSGEVISWSVGYGPRTEAWVLRPAGVKGKLPGVVLLHEHGGYKYYGKEKVADGPAGVLPELKAVRDQYYEGLAVGNEMARQGYTVLVHDVYMWGSRHYPYETMLAPNAARLEELAKEAAKGTDFPEIARYNTVAGPHENLLEKHAHILGTTVGGIVNFEDRVAVDYLQGRKDVAAGGVGCVGLSGGGMRSVLLQATEAKICAAVVVGAMSTFEGLLNSHVSMHTWMLFPAGFAGVGDWSDAAGCRAPSPLMVQYAMKDKLFSVEGMRAASRRIAAMYRGADASKNYTAKEYPQPHCFNALMQKDAIAFLKKHMAE